MCFAPQRRALFPHLNFQKSSDTEVLCTFWLRNLLRATTACTFSTSQLPKVVWSWCVLYILTSKCASRHNDVQFFISHLARWLRTRRFSEPTFRPSGATNHWENTVFRSFPTFSRICIFFLLTLSLLWPSLFCDSSHLYFSSVHIVGSLTSKLPSIMPVPPWRQSFALQRHFDRFDPRPAVHLPKKPRGSGACVRTIWRDLNLLTCWISGFLLLSPVSIAFQFCRGATSCLQLIAQRRGLHSWLIWLWDGGVTYLLFQTYFLQNFIYREWRPAKPRTGMSKFPISPTWNPIWSILTGYGDGSFLIPFRVSSLTHSCQV